MHVDTGYGFPEAIEFRDRRVAALGERSIVASMQESIGRGRVVEETGARASRNRPKRTTLLGAIAEHGFDAAFGGAQRDEQRARAKRRIIAVHDDFDGWDPNNRLRTVGGMGCTGAVRSAAADLIAGIAGIAGTRVTEFGETRADDRISEAATGDRRIGGCF